MDGLSALLEKGSFEILKTGAASAVPGDGILLTAGYRTIRSSRQRVTELGLRSKVGWLRKDLTPSLLCTSLLAAATTAPLSRPT